MTLWAAVLLGAAVAEEPSPEALFEAQTLELRQQVTGYGVVRADEELNAQEFAGLVGDLPGLREVERRRHRQNGLAAGSMGAAAVLVGAGAWLIGSSIGRNPAPRGQVAAGGASALAGVGLYGVAAFSWVGGARNERIDRHYSRDEAQHWLAQYHHDLAARLAAEAE
ncbi:MAG: hypothetical protein KC912_15205 [Proteobacteria bacterium]|nr:hypothetical protein [Pseudomonadota bacterium]